VLGNFNLDKTYYFLLVALAFLLPITVFGANLIIVIICILWIISGDFKSKFNQILNSKLLKASILFFCIHIIGLIWTEDINWGLHITHKMWYFVGLFPILYTIVRKENVRAYISAFLIAILISELISFAVWFEVIEKFKNAVPSNPTPFMSHISYNPILAFAIYLMSYELLSNSKILRYQKFVYLLFVVSMSINMFITGGRAGQIMFFAVISILIFQWLKNSKVKALIVALIVIPSLFITVYQTSSIFNERFDEALYQVLNYQENKNTSVGLRISYAINSWEVILSNPIIGVGTGDFPSEYRKINDINTPELTDLKASNGGSVDNPHNMYILLLAQFGIIGLISFLAIFYYQIKFAFRSNDRYFKDVGLALPLLFLLIMLSDSYLLGHYTSLMFVFFSSFLYKDFEKY
jgi:O-antigen ligase